MSLKQNTILLCLVLLLFNRCNNEIISRSDELLNITFEVYYTQNGDTLIDTGAKVFAYYNINQSDILDYYILNDGKLVNPILSSNIIYPDNQEIINDTGTCTLIPPIGTENLVIIIWSNFYEERHLKSIFTEYDFYYHGSDQLVKLYFSERDQGVGR